MRYLSVCSGIEAASQGWHHLGWTPAGFSEIEPFPRAVLEERLGAVPVDWDHRHSPQSNTLPLFGDFTKIEAHHVGPIDLLVGGTPCQSFSVAGKRLGLDDPRGHLTLEFLSLARRLRPRWIVWENVPGILSDDGGRTFGTFLGLLGECGFQWAYRVLDAQFVRVDGFERAVPQRRRRVFVVGYSGNEPRPAAVLFERESLRGNPAPRRETGQRVAPTISARTKGGGGLGTDFDCDGGQVAVAFDLRGREGGAMPEGPHHTANIRASNGGSSKSYVAETWAVRRLTPRECERLQGFPDDFTAVTYRGKPASDGPRYKALGNSMACNVMRWIGERIEYVERACGGNELEEYA